MIEQIIEKAIIRSFDGISNYLFSAKNNKREENTSSIKLGTASHPYYPERFEEATLDAESRLRHMYILGGSGTGKTKLIEALIRQDIIAGNGICVIDPHGDLTVSVLRFLAKSFSLSDENELGRKLVLVEPFNRECAIAFNPLEAGEQHFAVVLELMETFHRFFANGYWGPRMDELLRCTLITLSVNNFTLLEARPLLTNATFRGRLTENIPYNEVRDYWQHRYNQLSESMQSVFREPVLNRISAFITDPTVYRILGQKQSTLNFRQIMDEGKWVLVNMSKGYLKENMGLLGTIIVTKIKQAALSRIDILEEQRRPFYVYIDEFQNFVVEGMEEILSEARKFRLGMILSHQNLEQLPVILRAAILGNAQTDIFFRLSHRDASFVSAELEQKEKRVIERHLIDLNVRQAYLKTKGQKARLLKTNFISSVTVSDDEVERIKAASFRHWTRPVAEIEREIDERRNLWAANEPVNRQKKSNVTRFADYAPIKPQGVFEEGQNEW